VRWVRDAGGRDPIGLQAATGDPIDLADPALDALWEPPLYDAPALGLQAVSIGHVLAAALIELDPDEETPDRARFRAALGWQEEDWELALEQWRGCLEHGDQMAHFAVGYSLMELDRPAEAKEPLRRYSRLNPNNAWAWVWLGHACWAQGDLEGAEVAYGEAIERTARGSVETQAPELLERVRRREPWRGLPDEEE
jgi:predicted Zn-dependent protease